MIRQATLEDLEWLVEADLKQEGYTETEISLSINKDRQQHREKITRFVTESDFGALIYEKMNKSVGCILYSMENCDLTYPWKTIYHEIDRSLFQRDGRFIAIYQLWVHPDYRRKGIATKLKQQLEQQAKKHKVNLIYTHTEAGNEHVVSLNLKLGYKEVRRGPIWDECERISLIKRL